MQGQQRRTVKKVPRDKSNNREREQLISAVEENG